MNSVAVQAAGITALQVAENSSIASLGPASMAPSRLLLTQTSNSLDPERFRVDSYVVKAGPMAFWHPAVADRPGPGYYPYVAYNPTGKSQYGSSNGWSARAGEVAMEASNTGQFSLIRFTAPAAGIHEISARFAGVHFGLSSTDVHVLHNSQSLFDDFIESNGGDPAFHKIEGVRPATFGQGQAGGKGHGGVCLRVWKEQDPLQ